MTPDIALKTLAGFALEYVNSMKDRPCSQEALLARIQLAAGVLTNVLPQPVAPSTEPYVAPDHVSN